MHDRIDSELHTRIRDKKVLLGAAGDTGVPAYAELAGMIGYDLTWLDLEHGNLGWPEVQACCQAAQAGGAWPVVRVQSADRTHVMHALEVGARIVVVPMVNSAETARAIVEHGKYPPLGNRGFAGSTRAMRYGTGDGKRNVAWANLETHLFAQIETTEAVRACGEIMSVEGISGGLIGPADLSFSVGKPLAFDDADFVRHVVSAIRQIRAAGKIAAAATGSPVLIDAAVAAGLQLLICTNEFAAVRSQWQQTFKDMSVRIGR